MGSTVQPFKLNQLQGAQQSSKLNSRQQIDAGSQGAGQQAAAANAFRFSGLQQTQKTAGPQALGGVQGSQNSPQFGLNNPRPAEGVGRRLDIHG